MFIKIKKIAISMLILIVGFSVVSASDRDLPGIDIISRAQRGVDESMRLQSYKRFQEILQYRANYKQEMEELKQTDPDAYYKKYKEDQELSYHSKMANDYLQNNYGDELELDWTNKKYKGKKLRRSEYHHNHKSKIIIHHTASDNSVLKNKQDVKNYLSGVYYYHTITHGRGDIGYNFIIDPFGNIYEGRAGGDGVVGAHAKRNNTPSIGISLIGNFDIQKPTDSAVNSLINLATAVAKKYKINPKSRKDYHRDSDSAPYLISSENYAVVGHRDAGNTACPGENLYDLLPYIRDEILKGLDGKILTSSSSSKDNNESKTRSHKLTYNYFESIQTKIAPAIRSIKNKYIKKHNITTVTKYMQKLNSVSKNQAKIFLEKDISVLLYDLTQRYSSYQLSCNSGCTFVFDKERIIADTARLEIPDNNADKITLSIGDQNYFTNRVVVYSNDNLISIDNYNRKSYTGIPRNIFHGQLIFKKDFMKNIDGELENKNKGGQKYLVINKLKFQNYMKGIVETNDTESATKNEVMAMIAKSYALFYMHPDNIHPNIPIQATYNAVDDSKIFQKYVGAGLENTLTKWYKALVKTQDKIITYNHNIVILPYFSCSAGFTHTAKEERGRTDTPYLKTRFDLGVCKDKDFSGHGVGLSGLGAERRAKFGRSYQDILRYYYPGIKIERI